MVPGSRVRCHWLVFWLRNGIRMRSLTNAGVVVTYDYRRIGDGSRPRCGRSIRLARIARLAGATATSASCVATITATGESQVVAFKVGDAFGVEARIA